MSEPPRREVDSGSEERAGSGSSSASDPTLPSGPQRWAVAAQASRPGRIADLSRSRSGPVMLSLTSRIVASVTAATMLAISTMALPWGPFWPVAFFTLISLASLASIILASVWRRDRRSS
ncbi:MAG: hypothetical protein QOE83_19 [Actinomycetota bacterium]|nr:hypothetical protein [Actinomycetota bacterium]